MLPELSVETEKYLAWLYHRQVRPEDIRNIYRDAAKVIAEYVEPKWIFPGNEPAVFGPAAILFVHQNCARNSKDSFAARYCMHALLAPYSKAIQGKIG